LCHGQKIWNILCVVVWNVCVTFGIGGIGMSHGWRRLDMIFKIGFMFCNALLFVFMYRISDRTKSVFLLNFFIQEFVLRLLCVPFIQAFPLPQQLFFNLRNFYTLCLQHWIWRGICTFCSSPSLS
jgi:hypothetical protein